MILLTHLKAGFEKRGNRDCDCYSPDTLEGGIEFVTASMFRKVSMRLGKLIFIVEIHLLSRLFLRNAGSCLPKGLLNMEGRGVIVIVITPRAVCL